MCGYEAFVTNEGKLDDDDRCPASVTERKNGGEDERFLLTIRGL